MEERRVNALHELPTRNPPLIVQINLSYTNGIFFFTNGSQYDFSYLTMESINRYKCYHTVAIYSKHASQGFMRTSGNGCSRWDQILNNVKNIRFYGIWDAVVLKFFVSRATAISSLSFTHSQCSDVSSMLSALKVECLEEITMHVGKGQMMDVLFALEQMGYNQNGPFLKRLMLVFTDVLVPDTFVSLKQQISSILDPSAELIILYGGEDETCIKSLQEDGFRYSRNMEMAVNDLYEDGTLLKYYETYEVYGIAEKSIKWEIGCRIGRFQDIEPLRFDATGDSGLSSVATISLSIDDPLLCYDKTSDGRISPQDYKALALKKNEYGKMNKYCGQSHCCFPVKPDRGKDFPCWYSTRIQKVIFHRCHTEYLTSNGFYIMLDKMDHEKCFYRDTRASDRLVFHCTSAKRRHIVSESMTGFLSTVDHVEFVGTWHTSIMHNIAKCFPARLHALTIMQVELQTNSCIRNFFNHIPVEARENLKCFHYDGRATADHSLASILNALTYSGIMINGQYSTENPIKMNLDEIIIIASKMSDLRFKTTLMKTVVSMNQVLIPRGCAAIVLTEHIPVHVLTAANFLCPPVDTMVPVCYPNRRYSKALTRLMSRVKYGFESCDIYVVVPWFK